MRFIITLITVLMAILNSSYAQEISGRKKIFFSRKDLIPSGMLRLTGGYGIVPFTHQQGAAMWLKAEGNLAAGLGIAPLTIDYSYSSLNSIVSTNYFKVSFDV